VENLDTVMVNGFSSTSVALIDILVFLLISWGAFKGFQKGFLTELLSIIIFLVLLLGTFKLVQLGFEYLSTNTGAGRFSKATYFFTFLTAFFIVALIVGIIDRRMQEKSAFEVFEGLDNFVGLLLGAFKYAFALSILAEMLTAIGLLNRAEMTNTLFYPMLTKLFDFMFEIGNTIAPFIGELVGAVTRMLSR
jgi:membrane protein required for colicin V production